MRKQKFLAVVLATAMVLSLTACGNGSDGGATVTATPTPGTVANVTATPTPVEKIDPQPSEAPKEVSINFEDGNFGFAKLYEKPANADTGATLAIADFSGSKALQVTKSDAKKVPFVAFDVASLLGANVSNVASVELSMGISYEDGSFSSVEGDIEAWVGESLEACKSTWSVYLEKKNPNTVTYTLPEGKSFTEGNIIIFSLKTDNGAASHGNATLYIDNIRFLDAAGNLITADSSVAFVAPAGFENTGKDLTNLKVITNAVNFEGFALTGNGWGQNGLEMPQEFLDALVPGTAIEIEYTSEDGSMWIVMPWAAAGWMRVGDGNNGAAYRNGTNNIAQIPYEMIEKYCGTDKSTWGAMLQCEAGTNWEVFSVKVGTAVENTSFTSTIEFPDFATTGSGWGQNGFEIPEDVRAALVPGSVIEITYTSEDGSMWIVMPDSTAGWMRVGDGNNGKAICTDGVCYVTYEMIAEFCGEDTSAWGARLQCEAASNWEVYGVKVGTLTPIPAWKTYISFPDFATTGSGWGQNGFEIPEDVRAAMVPGSVIKIQYTSEDGSMWIVMPDSAAGWMRVGDGNNGKAIYADGVCYVTYEMIAEFCGEDTSTWGTRLQCEAGTNWEVFGVSVGK